MTIDNGLSRLLETLVAHDTPPLSSAAVDMLLATERGPQLTDLWRQLVVHRKSTLAEQLLVAILKRLPQFDVEPEPLLAWLTTAEWSDSDARILDTATREHGQVLPFLQRIIEASNTEVPAARLPRPAAANVEVGNELIPESTGTSTPAAPGRSSNRWISGLLYALLFLAPLVLDAALPFDLPDGVDLTARIQLRLANVLFLIVCVVALGVAIGLLNRLRQNRSTTIDWWWCATASLLVISVALGIWLRTWLYVPLTLIGQAVLAAVLAVGWLALFIVIGWREEPR